MKKFIRNLFLVLNILLALTLVSTYLARIVNPAKLWIPALLGLLYPYLLLANVVFIAIWSVFKKRFMLISILAIAIGLNIFNSYMNLLPAKKHKATELKVLSYNVHQFENYLHDKKSGNKFYTLFEEEKPDILCIQEAYFDRKDLNPRNLLASKYPFKYKHESKVSERYGIITYSKFPIIKTEESRFESSSNIFNYSDILYKKDTIRVYNCHLESYGIRFDQYTFMDTLTIDERRIQEFKALGRKLKEGNHNRVPQIKALIKSIKDCPYPIIVCGDFNDTPISYSYGEITKLLSDSFVEAGFGLSFTYRNRYTPYRIDYIFYSEDFKAFNYKKYDVDYSDHDPVSTTLHYRY